MSTSENTPLSCRERLRRAKAFGGFVSEFRVIYLDPPYGDALRAYLTAQGVACQVRDEPFPGTIHLGNDAEAEPVEVLIGNWLNGSRPALMLAPYHQIVLSEHEDDLERRHYANDRVS